MVGTSSTFLALNSTSAMKHLLAIEAHLRDLPASYESEEASCLVKHALSLEEQSDEGISHATDVGDKEKLAVFKDLQKGAKEIRSLLSQKTSPSALLKRVRELRKRAEALDPTFDLSKCATCKGEASEDDIAALEKLDAEFTPPPPPSFEEIEEGAARYFLGALAQRDGIEPPNLVIDPGCDDPVKANYQAGIIKVCRGGASQRVLGHEYGHHRQLLNGKPFSEEEADAFARSVLSQGLNAESADFTISGRRQMTISKERMRTVGIINGAALLGLGLVKLNNQLDAKYPARIAGQNPSLFVDLIGGLGLTYAALVAKKDWQSIAAAVAGSSLIVDLLNRVILPRVGIAGVPVRMIPSRVVSPVNAIAPQAGGFGG